MHYKKELMEFKFNSTDQAIRVEMVNKQPYFIAKDVCDALSLTDVSRTVERLDDDEKLTRVVLVSGQNRKMWLINESGLYNVIFQSRKPEAKAFRKWVTNEVLPSIRKTGGYSVKPKPSRSFVDFRDVAFDSVELNGREVRHIIYEDADWYNVQDVLTAIEVSTSPGQVVARLNAVKTLAQKFFLFGSTHPSWFCKSTGLTLILSGSRVFKRSNIRIVLPQATAKLERRVSNGFQK